MTNDTLLLLARVVEMELVESGEEWEECHEKRRDSDQDSDSDDI